MMMTRRTKSSHGFTMVEIAFSLAIVAFALVAIMGVLPTGMTVQKDNREDTLINNDGAFWTEALRSGSRGLDDLTNYVEQIDISNKLGTTTWVAAWLPGSSNPNRLFTGEQIVGLLSTAKYTNTGAQILSNSVIARVRAINGPAVDKSKLTNEFVFRYQLESEVTPVYPAPVYTSDKKTAYKYWIQNGKLWGESLGDADAAYHLNVATNLHNLRLTLRWPVFEQGNTWGVGRNHRTLVSLINGQTRWTTQDTNENRIVYMRAHPNTYQYVGIDELPKP
jgi:type II secretory pathway pseudopilin PulG